MTIAVFTALVGGALSLYTFSRLQARNSTSTTNPLDQAPAIVAVTALGRLEPQGEVTQLSAPSSASGIKVEQLLVKEGDRVSKGRVIAILEDYDRRKLALEQAKNQVQIANARLAQVKAGAKTGDIEAQKATIARLQAQLQGEKATQEATIARLQADLQNAQVEYERHQKLFAQGAISASILDSKRLRFEIVQQQLTEAKAALNRTIATLEDQLTEARARLNSVAEVRPTDIRLAQAELDSAITVVRQTQEDLNLTFVKSPKDGQILKVHTKAGEVVDREKGIVEIGKTDQMYVVAEIYQTDIEKVRLGQKAIISSTAFTGEIGGTVSEIGWQVERQSVFGVNPGTDTDRKIVEVKIHIDNPTDSKRVAGLTNLQVEVKIPIQQPHQQTSLRN
ncbi:MAG: ABC exporter membrane fusion protein [Scytonema sp. PMC 1069.18]|nr:ABC exporter membrane fusion protein [Scytonema sp. PMC 1069.18]